MREGQRAALRASRSASLEEHCVRGALRLRQEIGGQGERRGVETVEYSHRLSPSIHKFDDVFIYSGLSAE